MLHECIRNLRDDYLYKASKHIIKSFGTICLEDLNIKGMMQNDKLALAIGEVGWHKFTSLLEYEADWYGSDIIYIGRFEPSSQPRRRLMSHAEGAESFLGHSP